MSKKRQTHPYAEQLAFERLMLVIATLVQYPGVGSADLSEKSDEHQHHDALKQVMAQLQKVAQDSGIELPDGYPSTPTIRKDLETLRRYGILAQRMYRWGYYLGTGAMSLDELKVALNALASMAKYQGDSQARRIHTSISKRMRGVDLESNGDFFYPVRQFFNRAIIHTDPDEMMEKRENRDSLFHQLECVETAIRQGQAIQLCRYANPYGDRKTGMIQVWPLQLLYHDIAWYLIYEHCETNHLAVGRINRFKDYCQPLTQLNPRPMSIQYQRLQQAHTLLENGWGLFLGTLEEQQAEVLGKLPLISVKVRFFAPVVDFILEGERRHPSQRLHCGPKDSSTQKIQYVDYSVKLPPRSLNEFSLWVYRHMNHAEVLEPDDLRQKHYQNAQALVARFEGINNDHAH